MGDADKFVMALNNYRASGGGDFPHVTGAKVVYNEQQEIRQLLIEWATKKGVIDPDDFFVKNWALITAPLPAVSPSPSPSASASPSATATPSGTATPGPTTRPTRPQLPSTGGDDGGATDPFMPLVGVLGLLVMAGVVAHRRQKA